MEAALILLIVVGLGLLTAAVARRYGRDAVGWFVFGAMLFVIAMPLLLLLGHVEVHTEEDDTADLVASSEVLWLLARRDVCDFDTLVAEAIGDENDVADDLDRLLDAELVTARSDGFVLTPRARSEVGAVAAERPSSTRDPSARLQRLSQLRDEGLLSDDEYTEQRNRILNEL